MVAALIVFFIWALKRKRALLERFASGGLLERIAKAYAPELERLKIFIALAAACLLVVSRMPLGAGYVLGDAVAGLAYRFDRRRRERGLRHVAVAFPEKTGAERAAIVRASYRNLFRLGIETTRLGGLFGDGGERVAIDGFEHEQVLTQLASHGIQTRPDPLGGPIEPLSSYVTMRMPDRGGAPGGTPELYFTDPDGILIQIQDRRYCGGAGYLGEACAYV